jgi:hypothetical protein
MKGRGVVCVALIALVIPTVASAAELTLANVIDASHSGVDPQVLIQLIETADTTPVIGPIEEATLWEEGVDEQVIEALKMRQLSQPEAEEPADEGPDDPRMEQLMALVRAGLSQDLIIKQIRTGGVAYRPTTRDLIYLTSNDMPEAIVAALIDSAAVVDAEPAPAMATGMAAEPAQAMAPAAPAQPEVVTGEAAAEPEEPVEVVAFGPLLRFDRAVGVFSTKASGRLEIAGDTIRFVDQEKGKKGFEFFAKVLGRVTLKCQKHPDGPVCFELELKTVHGDEYRLRDVNWEAGGNAQIQSLHDTLEERYPAIKYRQKTD